MDYSIEEFDKAKTKVMNYIMYKKRTEYEVKNKFAKILEENLLNDIIEYVKEAGYLSDTAYIDRAVSEFKALNNLSRKEIKYKLYSKGIENSLEISSKFSAVNFGFDALISSIPVKLSKLCNSGKEKATGLLASSKDRSVNFSPTNFISLISLEIRIFFIQSYNSVFIVLVSM